MTLLAIRSREQWQEILNNVSESFAIHTMLADKEGKILLEGGQYNSLCEKVRADADSLAFICGQSNMRMFQETKETRAPCDGLCEIGMFKTVVPIFSDSEFIGGLSACGVAVIDEPLETFLIAKTLDIEDSAADQLVEDVPKVAMSNLERISQLFLRLLGDKSSIE
jgi:ligand-binding sensor protein